MSVLGPKLPRERSSYQIVTNPTGDGVLMLGGFEDGTFSNEIWQMKCSGHVKWKCRCSWSRPPYQLPTERSGFLAFYVPEDQTKCGLP